MTWSKKSVSFVKDDYFGSLEPSNRFGTGVGNVVCQSARCSNDDVRAFGKRNGLSTHISSACD